MREYLERYMQIREELKDLSSQEKALKTEKAELEHSIMVEMQEFGTDIVTVKGLARANITEQTVGQITDFEVLGHYIAEHDAAYLLQRRLNNLAYREMLELGEELPGVQPFTQLKLSVTVA